MKFNRFGISPIPFVSIDNTDSINEGYDLKINSFCSKRFPKDQKCKDHYKSVFDSPLNVIKECPYGFSSFAFQVLNDKIVFTCFIPSPRNNNTKVEKYRSKLHKNCKITLDNLNNFARIFDEISKQWHLLEMEKLKKFPPALHEIRKYNRTIKQEAERLCREENSTDPSKANPKIVRIWKAAEFMSQQFDIVEILASEELTKLPLKTDSEIYKTFDKCVMILNGLAQEEGKTITLTGESPIAKVNDKTFPIIPTTLLDNALKYSTPNSEIRVRIIKSSESECKIIVSNNSKKSNIGEEIFEKGKRGHTKIDGTGIGLYLAKVVAKQHNGSLLLETRDINSEEMKVSFILELPVMGYKN